MAINASTKITVMVFMVVFLARECGKI